MPCSDQCAPCRRVSRVGSRSSSRATLAHTIDLAAAPDGCCTVVPPVSAFETNSRNALLGTRRTFLPGASHEGQRPTTSSLLRIADRVYVWAQHVVTTGSSKYVFVSGQCKRSSIFSLSSSCIAGALTLLFAGDTCIGCSMVRESAGATVIRGLSTLCFPYSCGTVTASAASEKLFASLSSPSSNVSA